MHTCYDDAQQVGICVSSFVYLELAIRLREPAHMSDTGGSALPDTGTTDQPCLMFFGLGTEAADTGVSGSARFDPPMVFFASCVFWVFDFRPRFVEG